MISSRGPELKDEPERKKKEWLKAVCPICGDTYEYLPSYKPATCPKFKCLHEMAMTLNRR